MKMLRHAGFSSKIFLLLSALIPSAALYAATGYESISSNQPEYMPGDAATISGVGFEPNHTIEVQVIRVDGSIVTGDGTETPGSDTVTTDSTGHFSYSYLLAGGDRSVYNGIMTANAIDPVPGSTLSTTTFIDGDQFVIQGCDSNSHNKHCNLDTSAAGWAGGSNPINGWTSGELQGWQPLDNVPFRVRLDLKDVPAGVITVTTMQDYSTALNGNTVLALDSASDFYVGVGPGGSGAEGDLTKTCVMGLAGDTPTTATPCIVSGPTYSGGDPDKIQYTWAVLFDNSEVGGNQSKWGLYWTAHLNGGSNSFPGPNGKIYTTSSQTQNHTVDVKLEHDDDHDGVTNDDDHCNGTPDGEEVDHHHGDDHEGCGYSDFDYDHDGVNNAHDLCPGTEPGATVDANGCSAAQLGPYTLTISTNGTGSGTTTGAGAYNYGLTATVTATADTGSTFAGWSGPDAAACASGSVMINADKSCTATFTLNTYTLTLSTAGSGSGTVGGGGTYNYGSTATVTATADAGSTFSGWSGPDAAECATGSVSINADKSCTATFTLNTYTLSLGIAGTGSGTVGGAGVYNTGTSVPVSATADAGSTFAGWNGPDGTECATGSVVMVVDKSCVATFTLNTYTLSITTDGTGSGTVSGDGAYNYGDTATVSATAASGSTFAGWSGPDAAECATGSVAMDADKSCTATFTLNTYTLTVSTAGAGSGSVSSGGTYDYGATAIVSATADTGSTFSDWTGPDAAECATGSVLMDADKSCTANFTLNSYTLSIFSVGTGSGSVNGAGSYNYGTDVAVSATPNPDSTFDGWTGPDAAECAAGMVAMSGDKSCTATFTLIPPPPTYTLTLNYNGAGSGTLSGAGTYNSGDTASVSATAAASSIFSGWSGPDAAECDSGSVVMDADKSCTGTFVLAPTNLPDLIMSQVSTGILNKKANAGSTVLVNDTVTNQGDGNTGAFHVVYHLSVDQIFGNADDVPSATTRAIYSLAPGVSNAWTTAVVIPADTEPGVYYMCAKAGSDGDAVTESNSLNNWMCHNKTIQVPKPDFLVTVFANYNLNVAAGGTILVTDSTKNGGGSQGLLGQRAFDIGYVLSTNTVIGDADDIPLSSRALAVLGVGTTSTVSTYLTIPASVPAGSYYVGAIADVNGAVEELKEGNNTKRASNKVVVTVAP